MAEPLIEQSWNEWKGEVRARWGRLTEEDWQSVEADREQLLLALQQRYGWSREEAEVEFQTFVSTRTRLIDVDTLREEAIWPTDNGVRAQPGDVLGLDTDGETTSLGETAEDEDQRRVDSLQSTARQRP
jgi:uncharacterized protein YjbJ (UPF0337 family)